MFILPELRARIWFCVFGLTRKPRAITSRVNDSLANFATSEHMHKVRPTGVRFYESLVLFFFFFLFYCLLWIWIHCILKCYSMSICIELFRVVSRARVCKKCPLSFVFWRCLVLQSNSRNLLCEILRRRYPINILFSLHGWNWILALTAAPLWPLLLVK